MGAAPLPKKNVLGVGISAVSYGDVVEACSRWIGERRAALRAGAPLPPARYLCVTSVHGVITAWKNPDLRSVLNRADGATPDGMPVVWALRSFGVRDQGRVYGPALMLKLCERAAANGYRVFLYGATGETLAVLAARLRRRFPGLNICGVYAPPFRPLTPEEDAACTRKTLASRADLVFVGISTPKQERWMADHAARLPGVVMVGVGAAFDFHAGRVRQAPAWMQQRGLEWFFRLCMEPRRLWRRYLLETPLFLPLWALQKLGILKC